MSDRTFRVYSALKSGTGFRLEGIFVSADIQGVRDANPDRKLFISEVTL